MVETTLAIHRVFDSPRDAIVFDTGHQSYVHKLLTGRQDFSGLRQKGGLAGYPQRSESPHDVVESSHASSSLSWADGISRAFEMTGQHDRHVVAVVGDGALTGGITWEALNNISDDNSRNLVIVESFERIHRSNLIGMGVVPLQFPAGESWASLGLDGTEVVSISGIEELNEGRTPKTVHVVAEPSEHSPAGKETIEFDAVVRIDTPGEADYYRNGGILQYVLRSLV